MKILLTGSSGLIGSALTASLSANGHNVKRLLRSRHTGGEAYWNPEEGTIDLSNCKGIDVVIHLAGDSIAEGRWSKAKKARILDSRIKGTQLIATALARLEERPHTLISGSAIGFYGNRGADIVDEGSPAGEGFLAGVCQQWEDATAPAAEAGIRVVNVRFGMVLSSSGGALKKMLLPFKLGLGGVVGDGKQYMSWVGIDDVAGMVQHIINTPSLRGPVNLVSPSPVSNRQFVRTLGQVLHRPSILPMPAFMARIMFGEMADELLLASTRVMPRLLMNTGYNFINSDLREALESFLIKK